MDKRRGAAERLSHLQAAILAMVAEGERTGKGGAYGWGEIRRAVQRLGVTAYPGVSIRRAVYLSPADKSHRLTRRLSQEQKGLEEKALMASQRPSAPW